MIVITGGTKGIGRAIVQKFASENKHIVTCARNESDLVKLKFELGLEFGAEVSFLKADLADRKETQKFVDFVNNIPEELEILVNNTGFFLPGSIHSEEEGTLEKMINTNLYSAYHVTRGLIGKMIQRKKGHIFNICSTASIIPYINGGSYCISKFALYGMTKVLREEMKEHGVRVTAILPGATYTQSWENAETGLPLDRFMKPEDVADAIYGAYSLSNQSVIEEILIRPQLGDL